MGTLARNGSKVLLLKDLGHKKSLTKKKMKSSFVKWQTYSLGLHKIHTSDEYLSKYLQSQVTAQKAKFFIKDFFSKCYLLCSE